MLLVAAMCLSTVAFAAETTSNDFYSNEQADYVTNYTTLNALGIFDDELKSNVFSDKITQKKAYGYGLELVNAEWSDDNIAAMAKSAGFINSESDYRAYGMLTPTQASRIFVSILGYSMQAQVKGGYLTYANKLGITEGVNFNSTSYVTYSDFYQMVVNSLDVKISAMAYISDDTVKYETVADENLLSVYFDIDTVEGVVTENDLSTFYLPTDNGYGALVIGGKTYRYSDSHAYELLGHNVRAYTDKNDRVIYAAPYESQKLVITDDDFGKYTGNSITYYIEASSKEKKARLSSKPIVFYNDVAYPNYTKTDIEGFNGELVLIDNDNNGTYEVVKIYDYTYGFVESINDDEYAVRFSDPKDTYKDLTAYDEDALSVYNKDGLKVTFGYIMDTDFIGIAESKTKNKCRIVVHRDYFEGVLVSVDKDSVKIDDDYYDIAPFFKDESAKLAIGSEYKFYVDNSDRLVGVDKMKDASLVYGFIMGADKSSGLNSICRVKIFDAEGVITIYDLAEKVRVDGVSCKKHQVYDRLMQDNGSVRQLVKYRANDDNKLTVIDTSKEVTGDSYDTLRTEQYTSFSTGFREYYGWGKFAGKVITNTDCVFFKVPKVPSDDPDFCFSDDCYAVGNSYYDEDDSSIIKKSGDYMEFADIDSSRRCSVAVYYENTSASDSAKVIGNGVKLQGNTNGRAPLPVREIKRCIDENGDYAYEVTLEKREIFGTNLTPYAVENGNVLTMIIPDRDENLLWKKVYDTDLNVIEGAHAMLEPGDIVQFQKDNISGRPNGSYVVYDISLTPLENAKLLNKSGNYGYGKGDGYTVALVDFVDVDGIFGAYMVYDTENNVIDTSANSLYVLKGDLTVTRFDTETKDVYQVDFRNVKDINAYPGDYDYVFISSYYGDVNGLVIID